MRKAQFIIYDECIMQTKECLHTVNITLQQICENNKPFGGKILLLCGDFRQILPVIPGAVNALDYIEACVSNLPYWNTSRMYFFNLTKNERLYRAKKIKENVQFNQKIERYNKWLLKMGEGKLTLNEYKNIKFLHILKLVNIVKNHSIVLLALFIMM